MHHCLWRLIFSENDQRISKTKSVKNKMSPFATLSVKNGTEGISRKIHDGHIIITIFIRLLRVDYPWLRTGSKTVVVAMAKWVSFCFFRDVTYQTREKVFHRDIQTPRTELKIRRAAEYF